MMGKGQKSEYWVATHTAGGDFFSRLWRQITDIRSTSTTKGEFFLLTLAAALLESCGGGGGGGGRSPSPQTSQDSSHNILLSNQEEGGDDPIVVIVLGRNQPGDPAYQEYTESDLVNVQGTEIDVSSLLEGEGFSLEEFLDEVNNNPEDSAVEINEIPGGEGDDTIIVYGESDLSGVTLINIEWLLLNSDVTVNQAQLGNGGVTRITGGDGSVLRLHGDGEVRLGELDLENIHVIDVGENVRLVAVNREELGDDESNIQRLLGEGEVRVEADESDAFEGIQLAPGLSIYVNTNDEQEGGLVSDGYTFGGHVNEAPIIAAQSFSVAEDVLVGATVGTVAATDSDGDSLIYSITSGNDGGLFTIDGSSGAIIVAAGLDHETAGTHVLIVMAEDLHNGGLSATATVTITVTDVNEAPSMVAQSFSVAEDVLVGATVGTVTATDPDGDSLSYSIISGNNEGLFAIDGSSGAITVAAGLDHETAGTYTLRIMVEDRNSGGLTATATVTITVTDSNEAPSIVNQSFSVAEDVSVGATVGTVTATDPDGDSLVYSITNGNDNGLFAIDSSRGAITVAAGLDHETAGAHVLRVKVEDRDSGGLSATATVTVTVTDINEKPSIAAQSFSVVESAAVGTAVGTVAAVDPDGDSLIYSITIGNNGGLFAIDDSSGLITIAAGLDYETAGTHVLRVKVEDRDSGGLSATATVTIMVTDVNEAPGMAADSFSVAESAVVGTAVGTVTATDLDGDSLIYSIISGNDDGLFAINGSSGAITVAAGLDYEAAVTHTLMVKVEDLDSGGLSTNKTVTITVTDVNEAPNIAAQSFSIAENAASGSVVGTVNALDEDGDTLTYSITAGNSGGLFTINAATGVITIANGKTLYPYHAASDSLAVKFQDHDSGGFSSISTVTITVTDVNETPNIATQSFSIAENAASGSVVGTVSASDEDGDTLTYSITAGNSGGLFTINAATGVITIANGKTLDHETAASHTLAVTVQDQATGGLSASATVTITVTDVNEAPNIVAQSLSIVENAAVGAAIGTVIATDPDGDSLSYSITSGNDDGLFAIDGSSGAVTVAAGLDDETAATHTLMVKVEDRDSGGLSASAVVTITVTDVDDMPTTSGDLTFVVGAGRNYHLTVADLSAAVDESDIEITWEVTSEASNGYLAFSSDTSTSITSFTQTQLEAGEVVYIHSDSGAADSFAVSASGGVSVTINVEVVQDVFPGTPSYSVDNPWLEALLHEAVWNTSPADASVAIIEFAFCSGATTGDVSGYPLTAPAWTEHEKDAVRQAMAAWEAVCNIDFVEVAASEAPEIEYWKYPIAEIGFGILAYHYLPIVGLSEPLLGVFGYQATGWTQSGLMEGGIGFDTIVHELGHALGLAHPHGDSGGEAFPGVGIGDPFGVYGDYSLNQGIYTVMSYNPGWYEQYSEHYMYGPDSYGQVATPMALDIAAIQVLYGANTGTAIGDDTYMLPDTNAGETFWSCIWDNAGDDTISAAGADTGCLIDLRAADLEGEGGGGYISHHLNIIGGFTIANTVVIENAIGGSHNDMITGNAADNTLTGGGGADVFIFHDNFGSDTITDFDVNNDVIRFFSFAEVTSRAEFVAASIQDGADVVYDFDNDGINVLRLEGVSLSALQSASADDNFELGYITFSFAVSATAVYEGGAAAQVSVTLSASPGRDVAIPITITPRGGATANDYSVSGLTGGMLVFAATTSGTGLTQTFTITAVDDAVMDTNINVDEHLVLQVGALPIAVVPDTEMEVTVRLLDNDKAADFTVGADGLWTQRNIRDAQEADGIGVNTVSGAHYRVTAIALDDLSAYIRVGGAWAQGTDWTSLMFTASGDEEVVTFSDYQTSLLGDDDSDTGNYRIKIERVFVENSDAAANTSTTATMTTGSVFQGELANGDARDWISVTVSEGYYGISLVRSGEDPLRDPFLRLYDAAGNPVAVNDDILNIDITESHLVFHAPTAGTYYAEATSYGAEISILTADVGEYTLTFSAALPEILEETDAAAAVTTKYEITEDEVFIGALSSVFDRDWIELSSVSGINYIFSAVGEDSSGHALDLIVSLYNSLGDLIRRSDFHGDDNGVLTFNDTFYGEGTYYIGVSLADGATVGGDYALAVTSVDNDDSWSSLFAHTDTDEEEAEKDGHGHFHRMENDFNAYIEALGSEEGQLFG